MIALSFQGVSNTETPTSTQASASISNGIAMNKRRKRMNQVLSNYELYLFLLPTLIFVIIFLYVPMYGVIIAFKDFKPYLGIVGSPWIGFVNFERFFHSAEIWRLLNNTIVLSLYQLIAGFPAPILLAIAINYANNGKLKKIVQTVTYAPHFISTVVIVGMLTVFLSPTTGLVNHVITSFGFKPIIFLGEPSWFKSIYVWSGVWQNVGWGTIIYLAALAGINPHLHEAAIVDGATKMQRIRFIDIPGLLPTIFILFILDMGHIMSIGFEKAFLMQNALNKSSSDIIPTYVYNVGLLQAQYSFSTAVNLFNSVINLILLVTVNWIAKRMRQQSLW